MPEGEPQAWTADDYAFLVGTLVDEDTLLRAALEAERSRVAPHDVLIANGWVSPEAYVGALEAVLVRGADTRYDRPTLPVMAMKAPPRAIAAEVARARETGFVPLLVSDAGSGWIEPDAVRQARAEEAAHGLRRWQPELSAASRIVTWQVLAALIAVGLVIGGFAVLPGVTLAALAAVMTLPFLFVVGLRVLALVLVLGQRGERPAGPPVADEELPVYSIIVPLFQEANVLEDIVASLEALDYPPSKLDVLLVLESVDLETQAAARALDLPAYMRVLVVPDAAPRTKPKALNYALAMARGSYVVIYDAEDEPAPDQLRLAFATFRDARPGLACVQAQLNLYNADASWLTRQFTLEYTALFDAILPALVWLGLPVPLGGTSNHFPISVLKDLGGWDAHNVTEDADLGIRIARQGGRVAVLRSTTYEEAPPSFRIWLGQRTRWLKGFMQTWLVHMRDPLKLAAELGPLGFLGFHAFLGGIILSALVHPIFFLMLLVDVADGQLLAVPDSGLAQALLVVAGFNLLAGYASGMLIAGIAAARRGLWQLMASVVLIPVYWLLISLAAYRAAVQLVRKPYLWEKTRHSRRRHGQRRTARAASASMRA